MARSCSISWLPLTLSRGLRASSGCVRRAQLSHRGGSEENRPDPDSAPEAAGAAKAGGDQDQVGGEIPQELAAAQAEQGCPLRASDDLVHSRLSAAWSSAYDCNGQHFAKSSQSARLASSQAQAMRLRRPPDAVLLWSNCGVEGRQSKQKAAHKVSEDEHHIWVVGGQLIQGGGAVGGLA